METMNVEYPSLGEKASDIIKNLFNRMGLVKPGLAVQRAPVFSAKFEEACSLYRSRLYGEAVEAFRSLAREADERSRGMGRTSLLNAATSALMNGDNESIVRMLEPLHSRRQIYGTALWNLAWAYHARGETEKALAALKTWIERAPAPDRGRGWLVSAALCQVTNNRADAQASLQKAIEADARLVSSQLRNQAQGTASIPAAPVVGTTRFLQTAHHDEGNLRRLLQPKRPTRNPALMDYLKAHELEDFVSAIEFIAEGNYERAIEILGELRRKHSTVTLLSAAVASCDVFAGRYAQARNAFLALEDSGAELSGNAGWNLACAEIRLGNREGALRALQGCMRTEYRTKTELRQAITLLSQSPGSQPLPLPEIPPAAPTGPALLAGLPASPTECRIELLRRILIPKRVPNRYRPDMTACRFRVFWKMRMQQPLTPL